MDAKISKLSSNMLLAPTALVALFSLCALVNADPLTRSEGLINYPHQTHNLAVDADLDYQGSTQLDNMPYSTPPRIRIKLTRVIQNVDTDHLSAPEVSYFGALGVGTPKPNVFNVVFDTGSNEIWLPYWNWFWLANNLHYSVGYNCKDSLTCVRRNKEFAIDYRGTRLSGETYEDVFTLYDGVTKDEAPLLPGAQLTFGQNFLAISDAGNEQFRYKPYDGVIGLAPDAHSSTGTRNLLLSIQAQYARNARSSNTTYQDHIGYPSVGQPVAPYPSMHRPGGQDNQRHDYYGHRTQPRQSGFTNPNVDLIFAFWFNPNMNAREGGELMLGDVDESRHVGEIIWHRIVSYVDWELHLQQVQLGNQVVSCQDGCSAILDTGANSLVGPHDDVQQIYAQLQAYHDDRSGLWLVDCNKIDSYPVFVFKFDSYPYLIYPTHYVKMFRHKDKLVCHLAIKPRDSPHWVLGTTFIGAYYTVFNLSQRMIGFATPRE